MENTTNSPLMVNNRRLNEVANYMIGKGYRGLAKAFVLPVVRATAETRQEVATITNEMAIRNILIFMDKMASDPKILAEKRIKKLRADFLHRKNSRRVIC